MIKNRNFMTFIALCSLISMSALWAQSEIKISISNQEKIERIFTFLRAHPTPKGKQPPIFQQRMVNEVDRYLINNLAAYTTTSEIKEFIRYMASNGYVYDPDDRTKKMAYKMAQEQYVTLRYNSAKQSGTDAAYQAFVDEFKNSGGTQVDEIGTSLTLGRIRRAIDNTDYAGATRLVKSRIQSTGNAGRVLVEVDDIVVRKLSSIRDAQTVSDIIAFMEGCGTKEAQMPSLDRARVQYEQIKFDTAKSFKNEDALLGFLNEFKNYRSSAAAVFLRTARELLTSTGTNRVISEGETSMENALAQKNPDYLNFGTIYDALAEIRYRRALAGSAAEFDAFLALYQSKQENFNTSDKIRGLVTAVNAAKQKLVTDAAKAKAAEESAANLAQTRALLGGLIASVRSPATRLHSGELKRLSQPAYDELFANPPVPVLP